MSDIIPEGEMRKEIIERLTSEIATAEEERSEFLETLKKWERQREIRPETAKKNYPWPEASNVESMLTASQCNGIYAITKGGIDKKQPLIDVVAIDSKREGRGAEVLQKFLDILFESKNHVNIRSHNNAILYDGISFGTQFVKVPWEVEKWSFKRRDAVTGGMKQVTQTVRNSPSVVPVRLPDFLTRSYFHDLQRAEWYSTIARLLPHELKQRVAHGIYNEDAVDTVLKAPRLSLTDEEQENLSRRGLSTRDTSLYDIYETHLYWDIDEDGFFEDIVIWFHERTGTILRSEFNDLGKRDIVRIPYFNLPGQLYGMGVAWMCEGAQDEKTFLHNAYNDALHMSIVGMIATRRGSGYGDEKIKPGKVWTTDGEPQRDLMPFKLPGPDVNSINREMMIAAETQRLTGYNEYLGGQESSVVKTRATLGGTMFLAQQGSMIQKAYSENISQGYGEIAENVVFQLVRNRAQVEGDLVKLLPPEDQPILMQVLNMNPEEIPLRFTFRLRPTDPEQTKEAERQGIMTLTQLYITFGEKITMLMQMMSNPQMPMAPRVSEVLQKFIVGASKMMERILGHFGYDDTRPYIPNFDDIEMMTRAVEAARSMNVEAMSRGMAGANIGGSLGAGESMGGTGGMGGAQAAPGPATQPPPGEPQTGGGSDEAI